MTTKTFALKADQIKQLVHGYGSCVATDMITVEGKKVGYMYRGEPSSEEDSGWVFMSGAESQDYMDDADNMCLYHVNTIANYDQDIIPLLDSPARSAFERDAETGKFVAVEFQVPDE
jgi:hypothetical protein